MKSISAILLCAGESKRMGQDKLLLPWGRKTILHHSLQALVRSRVKEVILVVNDQTEPIVHPACDQRVKVVLNPYYRKGMSSSIRKGVEAANPRCHGILIALGDQPTIKSRTINVLIDAFHRGKGKIVVPSFRGRMGHPVIFNKEYREELLRLRGDQGGKSILKRHAEDVHVVPVRSAGILKDIDTWDDYRKELRAIKGEKGEEAK